MTEEAHQLADCLGDDHDLAVLHERAAQARDLFPTAAAHRALLHLIERCRAGQQSKALQLGRQLYAETPAVFTTRVGKYWHEWRHS